jgi:hypothetical protein
VEAWSRSAPEAALLWGTEKLRASGGTTAHWQSIPLQSWAAKDTPAALSWIESHADDKVRRDLLLIILGNVNNRLPHERAARIYSQIKAPALRTEFLTSLMQGWLKFDSAAARSWLEKSDALTPEQRAKLLATP